MKISICIPTWEQYGRGFEFLKNNFEQILKQTYKNFNVIISDHSKDDNIENYIKTLNFPNNIKLLYTRYAENYGSPSHNWNNGLKYANGDFLHTLCMDERYYHRDAIKNIVDFIKSTKSLIRNELQSMGSL